MPVFLPALCERIKPIPAGTCPQMRPMLRGKIVKGKQNFFVFLQALAGLWKFDLVTVDELLVSCQSRFAGRGQVTFHGLTA
jgi:hypothetical protein